MVISLEEFSQNCAKKRCLRHTIFNEKTCARPGKRERCFEKYIKKRGERQTKPKSDTQWEAIRAEVRERDGESCRLWDILTSEEQEGSGFSAGFIQGQVKDPAHVIRRSQSRKLYYEPLNIYLLSRVFHSRLDTYLDPLTGKSITREQAENWWIRIIGQETWCWLQKNK